MNVHVPARYRYLGEEVTAIRIVLGRTTKSDILSVCPTANVGAAEGDDTDLRWIIVDHLDYYAEAHEGEWIIRYDVDGTSAYWVTSDAVFSRLSAPVEEPPVVPEDDMHRQAKLLVSKYGTALVGLAAALSGAVPEPECIHAGSRCEAVPSYSVDDGYATYPLGRDLQQAIKIRDKRYPGRRIHKGTVCHTGEELDV